MDGENKGIPYQSMDDLGGKPTIFGNTHISPAWINLPLRERLAPMYPLTMDWYGRLGWLILLSVIDFFVGQNWRGKKNT